MKKILIAATVVGAIAGGLFVYMRNFYAKRDELDNVEDAADDAFHTMNKHIRRVERKTNGILN